MKLDNFFPCIRNPEEQVIIPVEGQQFRLCGTVYGKDGFLDGTRISTSLISKMNEDSAVTIKGQTYELGKYHPDYKELLSVEKDGTIPIINHWNLDGSREMGYTLSGVCNGRHIFGKVVSQDGNFVWLADNVKYYVIWRNISAPTILNFEVFGKCCGIDSLDLEEYLGLHCRPKLC